MLKTKRGNKDGVSNREGYKGKASKNSVISDVGIISTKVIKPFSAAFGGAGNVAEAGDSRFFFHVGF